jgi:hypothetical protein
MTICSGGAEQANNCTNAALARQVIAEDRDSTNRSRDGSVVMISPIGESNDQMRPLIICIPNQIATTTSPSIKSKLAISISS